MSPFGLIIRGMIARSKSIRSGVFELCFDSFGRRLALRQLMAQRKVSPTIVRDLANPVSCVRYFEYTFADEVIKQYDGFQGEIQVLDISSPRLWPFWLGEKCDARVTMVNPDRNDLAASRRSVRFLKQPERITLADDVDTTDLPFLVDSFDLTTSISVIEHINGDGDSKMMSEIARVTRSGGLAVVTFPVKPMFENEYRKTDPYGTQESARDRGFFFQRFYDRQSIQARIVQSSRFKEVTRRYYVENPPGWFEEYERTWVKRGLEWTVNDPAFMAEHFLDAEKEHPPDRMGICCLALEVQ